MEAWMLLAFQPDAMALGKTEERRNQQHDCDMATIYSFTDSSQHPMCPGRKVDLGSSCGLAAETDLHAQHDQPTGMVAVVKHHQA